MENPEQLAVGPWNGEQHIPEQEEQCAKAFLKELGQKLLQASICMDRDHRARDRSRETKEQRCEQNNKSSIRKWEQGRHQPRQNKLKGNVTLSWSMGLVLQQGQKARWKQNWGFLRHCKSKEKKLDKRANKTHQATTGLVLTLLNMKNTNNIPSNTFEKEIQ